MGLRGWDEAAVADVRARNGAPSMGTLRAPASLAGRGRPWEAELEAVHDLYRRAGRAWVRKTDPPVRQLGRPDEKGRFLACRLEASAADFEGFLASGVAVALEAKATATKTTFWLGAVQVCQAQGLLDLARAGGIAGVALLFRMHGEAFWLPALPTGAAATAVPARWCERAADPAREVVGVQDRIPSVRVDQLRAAGLRIPRIGGPQGLPDWLSVAVAGAATEAR